ncbi:post-transcriptional regulator [Paenibacillus puldeungensis]|uniref:Post-transcriptional regulator n=1 Tax=Paenibacillus puldeungensis TaxID=696536 RepID=A0ABW3RX34_9BACL
MAEEEMTEQQLNEAIEVLCRSKAEEFRLIGYEHVTGPDVWECISQKYEKDGFPPLYQLVNDILSLKATQFMNYMTISAYRGSRFD